MQPLFHGFPLRNTQIRDVEPEIFALLLEAVYTDRTSKLGAKQLNKALAAAKKYLVRVRSREIQCVCCLNFEYRNFCVQCFNNLCRLSCLLLHLRFLRLLLQCV